MKANAKAKPKAKAKANTKAGADPEVDTSGISSQQRTALERLWPELPGDIKKSIQEAKADMTRGKQQRLNIQMNALVPTSLCPNHKANIKVDSTLIERYRSVQCARTISKGEKGYTKTEIT